MHHPPAVEPPANLAGDPADSDGVANAAHLLRTPLTTIRGRAQLARRRLRASSVPPAEAATIDACLGAIDDAVERLDRSIDEVLHIGEAG